MGRIFEKRKTRMFARWAKMAKAFTKLGKEIAIAVRLGGPDPSTNPRLRMAVQMARGLNMPKDRIEAAIKRASGREAENYEEIAYEGYGPHKVALIVETATDNPTRTVANVRSIFNRHGGSFASPGALGYLFEKKGVFTIAPPSGDFDEIELEMIDHGLEEMYETDEGILLYSSFAHFGDLQRCIEAMQGIELKSAAVQRVATTTTELSAEEEADVEKLISALEDDDDVQNVHHNMKC
jgi:YebC/PmpR family DNA-binding regulatory protein